MELARLRSAVDVGAVDTVLLGFCDMQGRYQGKRLAARYFVDHVLGGTAEACDYLLAVDVDMNTVGGYATSSWDRGYGDFVLRPDLSTLHPVPWQEGTAGLLCDLEWHDGTPVAASPRQVLRRQLDRLAERGWRAYAGTELEFLVFRDTYEDAWNRGYRELTPANRYNVDYSMLGTARVEPLLRAIRNGMAGAGMSVESAKGECNPGQHEIAFRYDDVLTTCDHHTVYKNGAKEIAAQAGMALTFMPKFDAREGNSCHVHLSLRSAAGEAVFAADEGLFGCFLAGLLAHLRELALFSAPNVNSYKRYAEGSFAPTAIAWGRDNRTCALRVVGHGPDLRVENRVPGGDVNPYLACAAMLAAGLAGVEGEYALEPECRGNAYASDAPRLPRTLRDARELFAASDLARSAFGDAVVDHYVNAADVELAAFDTAVTDWERFRGFERL
ncbi:MAG TPA: glutamine synthetase family protein [Mycobacteriales bacterium]